MTRRRPPEPSLRDTSSVKSPKVDLRCERCGHPDGNLLQWERTREWDSLSTDAATWAVVVRCPKCEYTFMGLRCTTPTGERLPRSPQVVTSGDADLPRCSPRVASHHATDDRVDITICFSITAGTGPHAKVVFDPKEFDTVPLFRDATDAVLDTLWREYRSAVAAARIFGPPCHPQTEEK